MRSVHLFDFAQHTPGRKSPINARLRAPDALEIITEKDMRRISKSVASWLSVDSEAGVTAIEYGLIASLIALAIIVGATLLGVNLGALFTYIGGRVAPPA